MAISLLNVFFISHPNGLILTTFGPYLKSWYYICSIHSLPVKTIALSSYQDLESKNENEVIFISDGIPLCVQVLCQTSEFSCIYINYN